MKKVSLRSLALCTIGAIALSSTQASALSIVLHPDSGFLSAPSGAAALFAFQKAANYWDQIITTGVTLNFDVHFDDLGSNVLGATYSNTFDTRASTTYSQMAARSQSALDAIALANLRPLTAAGGVGYRGPGTNSATGLLTATLAGSSFDNNDSYNNLYINSNTTVAKALGINVDYKSSLFQRINESYGKDPTFKPLNVNRDADITFSSTFAFDFDPTDGIDTGKYDFMGVAIHEMGHALGFVSGTDDYDYSYINQATKAEVDQFSVLTNLDLFRYGINSFDPNGARQLQLDPNREAFFSIDSRKPFNVDAGTAATFSTGVNFGDGEQASHWKDAYSYLTGPNGCIADINPVGIMDPTIGACVIDGVSANDIAAFDAIGYNVAIDALADPKYKFSSAQAFQLSGLAAVAAVPEPTAWALMIGGVGVIGSALRRGKRLQSIAA